MLNGSIGLTGPQAKPSASRPTDCVAWIEIKGAINEGNSYIDVSLEVAENVGRVAEDIGVVARSLKRAARQIESVLTIPPLIFAPAICIKSCVQKGRLRKSQSIVRVTVERPPQEIKGTHCRFPCP